jgi:predicted PurR-regulated permease PerM
MLSKINDDLKKWLKGKLFAMLVVFILTSVGLLAIGLPLWLGQRFGNPCCG